MKNVFQALAVAIALLLVLPVFGEGIRWRGKWKPVNPYRSLLVPVMGNIDEETKTLTLDFQSDLGDVIVSITSETGNVVYQESIQTGETPSKIISLGGLDVNGGTISITDGENLIYSIIIF